MGGHDVNKGQVRRMLVVAVGSVALTVGSAPAQAEQPAAAGAALVSPASPGHGCAPAHALRVNEARLVVIGMNEILCENPDNSEDLPVSILRNGETVASGRGTIVYHCTASGMEYTYRLVGARVPDVKAHCE
jgi:hypothetical protein